MFSKGTEKYGSDIKLGEKYRDTHTGIEGVATALSFYEHGCERVSIEVLVDNKIEIFGFDAPRVALVQTNVRPRAERTGGPGDPAPSRTETPAR